jgi:riboflavin synthase
MFTGLVAAVGRVERAEPMPEGLRLTLGSPLGPLAVGESVAMSGACLTVTLSSEGAFTAEVSQETLARTTLGRLSVGSPVNLERAALLGDRLGGHLVAGHVDGIARVLEVAPAGEARRVELEAPAELARFIAEKGSLTLDGVSLTVNSVRGARFSVMLVPHTLAVTTLGALAPGDALNLEVDLVARYVARYLEATSAPRSGATSATESEAPSPADSDAPPPSTLRRGVG